MRFAWERKKAGRVAVKQSTTNRLIWITYNTVYWIPVILAFAKAIDYRTGFGAFAAIVLVRGIMNLITNNALAPEQAEYFPFRGVSRPAR
jgi:hypothetical protein